MRRALLWFKQDLRLDDHPALIAAADAERVLPLYIFDPAQLQPGFAGCRGLGVHRARFLMESLVALDGELRQRGSGLLVMQGNAEELLPRLVEQLDLDTVLTLEEIAPTQRRLLNRLQNALSPIPLRRLPGNQLLQSEQLAWPAPGEGVSFSGFRRHLEALAPVFQPCPAPARLPALPLNANAYFAALPSLSQLGLGESLAVAGSAFPFAGGEPAAQARLRDYLWQSQGIRQHKDSSDGLIGSAYSSKLSPWLASGCLSPRRVIAELRRHEAQYGSNGSTQYFWQEMLWREFFHQVLQRHDRALLERGGVGGHDPRFNAWCQGRTGMPLVDASMRELAATGFLSARARLVTASYLIADLEQDWRLGASWFEEHLIDHDPACNWGNWARLASCPRSQASFNALQQARRCDPHGHYISLWVPELRELPAAMRHTPFLLSQNQLTAIGYPLLERVPTHWQPYLSAA